jgi:hypothetical protein
MTLSTGRVSYPTFKVQLNMVCILFMLQAFNEEKNTYGFIQVVHYLVMLALYSTLKWNHEVSTSCFPALGLFDPTRPSLDYELKLDAS